MLANIELAYTPGVGEIVQTLESDPLMANYLTNKKNTVVVITNGTAVLGFGKTKPISAKPVMEGKSAFLIVAGMNSFDIEVDQSDPKQLADIIIRISEGFGGIILEDIKAPDCFIVEEILKDKLDIPIMHDDQHGTAIVISAAILSWAKNTSRSIENIKLVCVGAGAAAIATMKLLLSLGFQKRNIKLFDSQGLVGENPSNQYKAEFSSVGGTLEEEIRGADILLGLSVGNSIPSKYICSMNSNPLIMVLSNPVPEIDPKKIKRPDAVICTGRSDFENQINNVLCFPSIMRLATAYGLKIEEKLKIATVNSLVLYSNLFNYGLIPSIHDQALSCLLPTIIAEKMNLPDIPSFAKFVYSNIIDLEIEAKYRLNTESKAVNLFLERMNLYLAAEMKPISEALDVYLEIARYKDIEILVCSKITNAIIRVFSKYYKNIIFLSNKDSLLNNYEKIGFVYLKQNKLHFFYNPKIEFVRLVQLNLAFAEFYTERGNNNE